MAVLNGRAPAFPHYAATVTNGETYMREVSLWWSTDPRCAEKVWVIYVAVPLHWRSSSRMICFCGSVMARVTVHRPRTQADEVAHPQMTLTARCRHAWGAEG